MRTKLSMTALALAAGAAAQASFETLYTATSTAAVAAAAATAKTSSPTSNVKGKAFDRMVVIWLENTDYTMAAGDPNLAALAKQGIALSNYNAVTHPSEPNYAASIGGDYFGMDNDNFNFIPSNISSIVDLLEDKGISWGEYQEDMPYSGFEGFAWVNQQTKANDYVRKHNPAILYNSVTDNPTRLSQIKNLTQFYADLAADKLPQWMFITPNMTSDGHDTSVTVAGAWTKSFLTPLLNDKRFMKNTMVLITFDENHTYTLENRILAILLGDAIPSNLIGTTDSNFYDHYSEISTAEANWDLHTLGRYDVGANVFSFVGAKTGDKLRQWQTPDFSTVFLNYSYPGLLNSMNTAVPLPAPNISLTQNGRTVLPAIAEVWAEDQGNTPYTGALEIPDGAHLPVYSAAAANERWDGNGWNTWYSGVGGNRLGIRAWRASLIVCVMKLCV